MHKIIIKLVNSTEQGGGAEKQMFIRKCLDRHPLGKWKSCKLARKHVFDEEHRWVYVPVCVSMCVCVQGMEMRGRIINESSLFQRQYHNSGLDFGRLNQSSGV